ncbi:hypothetical protein [Herbihabitans rhizosphaerae]|uniref:hypothetical protein n=1 Tax=Herbihabitans rhizosphaerae TaxID=1872711 RepID=UPI00102AF128|nr:hypothetical protein [Herbihabitans rhizosphaerae]
MDGLTTEAKRLRLALDMYEFGVKMLRQRIRRENPGVSDREVTDEVRAWRHTRPGAENGDYPGPPSRRFA